MLSTFCLMIFFKFDTSEHVEVGGRQDGICCRQEAAGGGEDGAPTQQHATAKLRPSAVKQGHLQTQTNTAFKNKCCKRLSVSSGRHNLDSSELTRLTSCSKSSSSSLSCRTNSQL